MSEAVAALIVTFNSSTELPQCLADLRNAGVDGVYVFDNASKDSSAMVAEDLGAVTVRSLTNLGFAAAVNRGMESISESFVLLLNPDCLVTPRCLELLRAALTSNPGLAAVVPAMQYPDGSFGVPGGAAPSVAKEWLSFLRVDDLFPRRLAVWLSSRRTRRPRFLATLASYVRRTPDPGIELVDWVSGFCMLLRREAFETAGRFDEDFFMYFEDADLCSRLRQLGLGVAIVGEAVAVHDESSSASRSGKSRLYAAGMRTYFAKHGTRGQRIASDALATLMR